MTQFIYVDEKLEQLAKQLDTKVSRQAIATCPGFVPLYDKEMKKFVKMFFFTHGNHLGRFLRPKTNHSMATSKKDSACDLINTFCINWHLERSLKFPVTCIRKFWNKYADCDLPDTRHPFFEARPAIAIFDNNYVSNLLSTGLAKSYEELPHMVSIRIKRLTKDIEIHLINRKLIKNGIRIFVTSGNGAAVNDDIYPDEYKKMLSKLYPDAVFIHIIPSKVKAYRMLKKSTYKVKSGKKIVPTSGEESKTYWGYLVAKVVNDYMTSLNNGNSNDKPNTPDNME